MDAVLQSIHLFNQSRAFLNSFLSHYEPLSLILAPVITFLLARFLRSIVNVVHEKGIRAALTVLFMSFIKLVPGVKAYIDSEKQEIVDKMQASGKSDRDDWRTELPREGLGFGVLELLKEEKQKDVAWHGKCSGTVYIGGSEHGGHFSLINEACSMFSHTNPLHMDVFKSVGKFEAEVVAMTAALLGSKEKSVEGQVCGNMTSGGTESILMAVKASRDYMKAKKGISKPEMIIPVSAHSAYDKAAQYFNIKLWRVPVNREFQADVKAIKRHINRNTIMIVGSAPGFPHGIIDPIEELGELACSFGICFHVDLCLGGFVLPFARKLGYPVPPYDFSVNGVTSISADVHKYGLAPKGTSVVLYRNHDLRKHQFVAVTEWSGGLYVSPTVAGVLYILDLGLRAIYSYILEDKDVLKRTGIGVRLALKQGEELNDILTEIDLRYKDEFYIPAKRGNGDHIMSLYIILVKSFLDADFHFKNVFTNAPKNFDNQINRVREITLEQQLSKMQATGFRKGSILSVFEYLASFGVIVVDIQTFDWDPGLVWVIQLVPTWVIEVNFQTFVWDPGLVLVSFRFSTLRTRCSFRGGVCHDTTFYYYFYMYFRIFVFGQL